MFETAQVGRVPVSECSVYAALLQSLEAGAFKPLEAGEKMSIGFIDPYDEAAPPLGVELPSGGFCAWVRIDERDVAGRQIESLVRQRAAAHSASLGRTVGDETLDLIRHQVSTELTNLATAKETVIPVILGDASGCLVIGTGSNARRDQVMRHLGKCLDGRVSWNGLFIRSAITKNLTKWVVAGEAPTPLCLGDRAVLKGTGKSKASIRVRNLTTDTDSLRLEIGKGMQVEELGLTVGLLDVVCDASGLLRGIGLSEEGELAMSNDIPEDLTYHTERTMRVRWESQALLQLIAAMREALKEEDPAEDEDDVESVAA